MNIVLVEPEIPMNTGNIGRTCVLTGSHLHLIRPLGFSLSDAQIRRSGLDYWEHLSLTVYDDLEDFFEKNPGASCYYATTKAQQSYTEIHFQKDDFLVFGKESKGLPLELLGRNRPRMMKIPMDNTYARSLNLSNSVAIILYEALHQTGFQTLR